MNTTLLSVRVARSRELVGRGFAVPAVAETLDDARRGIGGYVDRYHHRPYRA